ncbi:MAG: DUF6020 family protein, partial [Eubacteriales bacterium]
LFVVLFYFYKLVDTECSEMLIPSSSPKVSLLLSGIFTIFYVLGDYTTICGGLDNKIFCAMVLLITSIGLLILFYRIILFLFTKSNGKHLSIVENKHKLRFASLSCLACFLCWIPYLGKNFPGVMTVDSMNQFAQVLGVYAPSNHHPYVHTLLIGFWYHIGQIFTPNISYSLAFYTVFQMIFLASCIGYCIYTLLCLGVSKKICLLLLSFYAFVPYNGHYGVTMWKDPIFAGGALLLVITLLRMLYLPGKSCFTLGTFNAIMFFISSLIFCLFRTNGWYAYWIMIPVILVLFRAKLRPVIMLICLVITTVLLIKGPVMNAYDVIQPDLVESLSIPAQQLSRVIVSDKPLTEEQNQFLNEILDTSQIVDLYNPYVSDGFKRLVREGNPDYLEENFGEFIKVYLEIGLTYPLDYFLAFTDQSIGFWFPSQEGIIAGDEGIIANEFGVTNEAFFTGALVIKINEICLKLKDMVPLYGILWNMGGIFWIILFSCGLCYVHGDKRLFLLYLPCFAVFFTLVIATPVAKEFRYAYSYIYCLPLYLILPFIRIQKHQ